MEGADVSLVEAALPAPKLPNKLGVCAAAGVLTVPLGAAVVPGEFAKLDDGVDGCFDGLARSVGALAELVGCPVEGPPKLGNPFVVDLISAGLVAAASGG